MNNYDAEANMDIDVEITEEQMLDMAEQIFMLVAQRLLSKSMSVRDAFG